MEKIDAVLVTLNPETLTDTVNKLNLDEVNLNVIITDSDSEDFFLCNDNQIPLTSFVSIRHCTRKYKDFFWLIDGRLNSGNDLSKLKNFLVLNGVSAGKIINLETLAEAAQTFSANVEYVKEHGADFFATGNEYMRDDLNLKLLPCVREDESSAYGGANLSCAEQNLLQSYHTAQSVFAHVPPGKIKFVLIGLTPNSFSSDDTQDFFDFQNILKDATEPAQPDLNFAAFKATLKNDFSAQAIIDRDDDAFYAKTDIVEDNVQILKAYIKLCRDNNAEPVGVIFPFTLAAQNNFNESFLNSFRETIHRLEEECNFFCADMFDLKLGYDCFCDMTHLNARGRAFVNAFLAFKLFERKLIPAESFCDRTYEYLDKLSYLVPAYEYNAFLAKVFGASEERIRRKEKIKVGFVLYDTSMWAGDELYNLFMKNNRFEVSIFLYMMPKAPANESIQDTFLKGLEKFKTDGFNVVPLKKPDAAVPVQDVIILLTPYVGDLPKAFQFSNLTAKTLATYVSYSFSVARRSNKFYNRRIFHTSWKVFLSSAISLDLYARESSVGLPRGFFSGYPRTDVFFDKNANFRFDWKMTRPDAKKIIWAPHHSIGGGVSFATFHLNYEFMYEFAKAHPEISWVVKPHPALIYRAVQMKIFRSAKAFQNYMDKWDALPNAQVYTGGYYQDIFATSDGMIHDSGSFIAEYQFVDKPMIYLTRPGSWHNELGEKILKVSYLVDGKDFDGIAVTIQKVFVEGKDDLAAARRKVFNKYLNYPKLNGMLASEFIYRSIADDLREVSS